MAGRDFDLDIAVLAKPESALPEVSSDSSSLESPQRDARSDHGRIPWVVQRLHKQNYHPVLLIGSSAAGKTALLLSLLAYFKQNPSSRIGAFFGQDLFRGDEVALYEDALQFFNRSVAEFLGGETAAATRIGAPMFIPVRINGSEQPEVRLAFIESEGEWFQPDPNLKSYYKPFRPDIEDLLGQYPEGISVIWVAPYAGSSCKASAYATADPNAQTSVANESLQGAMANYEALRSQNCEKDSHIFLVTKWDNYKSQEITDITSSLDRNNDPLIRSEVNSFLYQTYRGAFSTFNAIKVPDSQKSVFRYTAGAFRSRTSLPIAATQETLLSYPRDMWNWLHRSVGIAHPEWNIGQRSLIPPPPPPKKSIWSLFDKLMEWL